MRILEIGNKRELPKFMVQLGVDPYGIKIMLPKAANFLIKIDGISSIAANILKQEMLSLGGDVAVPKDVLTCRIKKTGCLLIGNLSQFNRLNHKLNVQPFGLGKIGEQLTESLQNYQKDVFNLTFGRNKLDLGRRTVIMGIVNLTPDSFSGDGMYRFKDKGLYSTSDIIAYSQKLICDGADIIDVGGESSRPGAKQTSLKEELRRVIPVIKALIKRIKAPISIDTYKPQVARQALDNGAVIVNDISGLRDKKLAKVIASYKAGVVIMHMKGTPRTMQKNPRYEFLMDEIIVQLADSIRTALDAGIAGDKIIIDPGIGFGKTLENNLEILKRLKELKILGKPILVGPSRKSFIGNILNAGPSLRLSGTISSCILASHNGANIVRVHDVKQVAEALRVSDRINFS